jgi:hypothetical protein
MGDWLGLQLDLEPERPEHTHRAPGISSQAVVIVRQFDPRSMWYRHHAAPTVPGPAGEQEAAAK